VVGSPPTRGRHHLFRRIRTLCRENRLIGYGYAVYSNGKQIATGYGAINSLSLMVLIQRLLEPGKVSNTHFDSFERGYNTTSARGEEENTCRTGLP